MFNKIMAILALLTGTIIIVVFGYVLYLLAYDIEVVEFKEFTVTQASIPQDGAIPYTLTFDKKLDYKPDIRYYIISEHEPAVEIVVASVKRSTGPQTRKLALPVPHSVNPGCGKQLQIDISYEIIFNRHIDYSWQSNTFCITPPREGGS